MIKSRQVLLLIESINEIKKMQAKGLKIEDVDLVTRKNSSGHTEMTLDVTFYGFPKGGDDD